MTSALLLVGFCAVMTAVAVARFLVDGPDPYRGGIALLVFGITLLAGLWSALRTGWATTTGRLVLGAIGIAVVVAGTSLLVRHWEAGADGRV